VGWGLRAARSLWCARQRVRRCRAGPAVAIYDALIVLYTDTRQSSWAVEKTAQLFESMGLFENAARAYERHTKVRASERPRLLQQAVTFRLALEHDLQAEADTALLIKMLLASGQVNWAAKAALELAPVYQRRGQAAERAYLKNYLRRFGRRSGKKETAHIRSRLAELRWGEHQDLRKAFAGRDKRTKRKRSSSEATNEAMDVWEPVFSVSQIIDRASLIARYEKCPL
jgi:hypothetical protein